MRAADILAKRLYEAGCRFAFGMPGGEVLTLLDALEKAGIRFVLAKHENAAGFMAEATWHRTGAPGILLGTVGPGILNAVNVVANAEQDRVPLIAIAGCVDPAERLTYSHQVLDHTKVFDPLCKAVFTLTAEAPGEAADKAVQAALSPRPGPVFIDVPISVAAAECGDGYALRHPRPSPAVPADGPDLDRARAMLTAARRPLMIAGFDAVCDGAGDAIRRFCESLNVPLITTYKAKGIVPEDHALAIGAAALSPSADAVVKPLVAQADLILLAGYDPIEMRVGWRNLWDPAQTDVIEIAARPNDQYMHQATISFVADTGGTLDRLSEGLTGAATWPDGEPAAVRQFLGQSNGAVADWGPGAIAAAVRDALPRDAIATVDSGAHRIVLSQVYRCFEPRSLLQSMGLCTMGCALPLAIGAKIADPERPVVAFTGDGGLMMVLGELSTLADYGLPVPVIVFSDRSLALIELKQRGMQLGNAGVDFAGGYDYVALAKAFGGACATVRDRDALTEAVTAALQTESFTLIVCEIDRRSYDGVL
ncbi:MAG: thiamine pyrophosphate-binding protein [Alphaproteobacteria bacterium]|nr:thiamine pyrophosphate-binding protein [Alphaproteobacteria bacterium]MBO6864275.1 thiamine pyrophosphate-binding protein [Alphaproteobacteria bacterium]